MHIDDQPETDNEVSTTFEALLIASESRNPTKSVKCCQSNLDTHQNEGKSVLDTYIETLIDLFQLKQ